MIISMPRFTLFLLISLSFLANICIATPRPYIIYPALKITQAESDDLTFYIGMISVKYYDYKRWQKTIPEFWVAWLTTAAYTKIRSDPRIREIHLSEALAEPAVSVDLPSFNNSSPVQAPSEIEADISVGSDPSYTTQVWPRATELRLLSQPPGLITWTRYNNYVYKTGGAGTYIYHAELGVTAGLDVPKSRIEWLYTPEAYFWGKDRPGEIMIPGYFPGHGTCTASKAAGRAYGVAREATLVVVKMVDFSEPSLVSVLNVIADDVKQKGRGGKSVVTISWTTKAMIGPIIEEIWLMEMRHSLEELYKNNVIVVCSAGNNAVTPGASGALRDHVDTAPPMFANRVIPVGASYFSGIRWQPSQTPIGQPQIYAPGVAIVCADASGRVPYRLNTGTSFSSPLVAGVIAGFLALGQIPFPLNIEQLTEFLHDEASWQRGKDGQHVIWNQVDFSHNPPIPEAGNATASNLTASGNVVDSNLTASFFESNVPGNGQFSDMTDKTEAENSYER